MREPFNERGTMAEYRVRVDEGFLNQAYRRYRNQYGTRYLTVTLRFITSIVSVALAAYGIAHRMWWLPILIAALFFIALGCHLFMYWFRRRTFRKSPHKNEDLVIMVTADGLHSIGTKSDIKLIWAAFNKARRFSDGILLFQDPVAFSWLPEAALVNGTAAEVASLAETNVRDYKIVE